MQVEGGGRIRKVALLGLLTEDPNLYREGAWGGATIDPVASTAAKMKEMLQKEHNVDLVIPMTHQVIFKFVDFYFSLTFVCYVDCST